MCTPKGQKRHFENNPIQSKYMTYTYGTCTSYMLLPFFLTTFRYIFLMNYWKYQSRSIYIHTKYHQPVAFYIVTYVEMYIVFPDQYILQYILQAACTWHGFKQSPYIYVAQYHGGICLHSPLQALSNLSLHNLLQLYFLCPHNLNRLNKIYYKSKIQYLSIDESLIS